MRLRDILLGIIAVLLLVMLIVGTLHEAWGDMVKVITK